MDIIPVIDLKAGRAVHAVAGERAAYQPLQFSPIPEGDAVALAAFYAQRQPPAVYVADLDAIEGEPPQIDLWRQIASVAACPLWIDCGFRSAESLFPLLPFFQQPTDHRPSVILGTETLTSPNEILLIAQQLAPGRLILSIDRKAGAPIGAAGDERRLQEMLHAADAVGIRNVIALDLAAVGQGRSRDFLHCWRPLMQSFAGMQWRLGGGIRGKEDLEAARDAGFYGVLSATAILQGAL